MAGKAGLKAGLIGAVAVALLTTLSILLGRTSPALGRICGGLVLLAYAGAGALAGFFLAAPRTAGHGARAGAIAGLVSGAGGGVAWVVAAVIRVALNVWGDIIPFIDLQQPTNLGGGMEMVAVMVGGLCFLTSLVAGAGFGAIGGAIFGAAKRD